MTFDDFQEQCLPVHTARFPQVASWIKKAGDHADACITSFHRSVKGFSVEVFLEASERMMNNAPRFGQDHPAAMADKCLGVPVVSQREEEGGNHADERQRFPVGTEVVIKGRSGPNLYGTIESYTMIGAMVKLDKPRVFRKRTIKVYGRTWAEIKERPEKPEAPAGDLGGAGDL